jgi:hypothetical protein
VTGTVTYESKPVPNGTVTFFIEGATPVSAPIADGRYEAHDVPLGDAMVSVVSLQTPEKSPRPSGKPKGGSAERPDPPPSNIPLKYGNPSTSDLRFKVERGQNTFPLDLK